MSATGNQASENPNRRGLSCRACGHQRFHVIYTRPAADSKVIRRRACKNCGRRFTTWERAIGGG